MQKQVLNISNENNYARIQGMDRIRDNIKSVVLPLLLKGYDTANHPLLNINWGVRDAVKEVAKSSDSQWDKCVHISKIVSEALAEIEPD